VTPTPRRRLALSILVGCLTAWVTWRKDVVFPFPRDLGQVWFAARSILHGVDPYPLVGPGLAFDFDYPLLYPLPAGVAILPLGALPLHVATVLFSFGCGMALAWTVMRWGYGPLFGVLSAPAHYAAETAQWSPLFAASVALPWLGIFLVAKPTVGLAAFVARPSWWAVGGALVFGGLAFAVNPHWVAEWLANVHRNAAAWAPDRPYRVPLTYPGGAVALLALLRWRRPEARYLAALACVPQTPLQYEAVPLVLVPRTFWEAAGLFALSYTAHLATEWVAPQVVSQPRHLAVSGQMIVLFLYLPAALLLLTRPNRSDLDGEADGGVVGSGDRDGAGRRDRGLFPLVARLTDVCKPRTDRGRLVKNGRES
jgi:hypothetical protein